MADLQSQVVSGDKSENGNPNPIESLFDFRNETAVSQLLTEEPYLCSLLLEAHERIESYFPGSQLILEVVSEPEDRQDRELVLFIVTRLAPDEAMANLERLDEDWWLDSLEKSRGKLCITLEFR